MSGYRLGNITLFPVTYDATSETLLYHSDITLTVTTEPVAHDGDLAVRDYEDDQAFVGMMVENPEMLSTYAASGAGMPEGESRLPAAGPYEYVIITSSELYVDPDQPDPDPYTYDFADLIRHKRDKGLTATIVTTDYIDANYDGLENDFDPTRGEGDLADKIREFLWEAWQDPDPDAGYDPGWGTQWVLLGGDMATDPNYGSDAAVVPMRQAWIDQPGFAPCVNVPTDMYYACLSGPWNYDGDQYWAEPEHDGANDGWIDHIPDINVGRAPVRTAGEIHNFVAKTIQYETNGHANSDQGLWVVGAFSEANQTQKPRYPSKSRDTRDILRDSSLLFRDCNLTERYDWEVVYGRDEIVGDLNTSPHFVYNVDHAWYYVDTRLYPDDVAALENEEPYLFYSVGCYSGALDGSGPTATYQYCMAEAHLLSENAAVAVVMNTRYGYLNTSEKQANSFWEKLFETNNAGNYEQHVGAAHMYSKIIISPTSSAVNRWVYMTATLFGDPELEFQANFNQVATGTDLGEVDYLTMVDLDLGEEDREYQLQTAHDGYLTIVAVYRWSWGDVELSLLDENKEVLVTAEGSRIDWDVDAAQTYYVSLRGNNSNVDLRIVNLVEPDAAEGQITVHGSDAYDELNFPWGYPNVNINGISYSGFFDTETYPKCYFEGNGQSDTVYLRESSGDDELLADVSSPNEVHWNLADGTEFVVADANVYVDASSYDEDHDTATLQGSNGDDVFRVKYMSEYECFHRFWDPADRIYARRGTLGFETVTINAGSGDNKAYLVGSSGDDLLEVDTLEETAVFTLMQNTPEQYQYLVNDVKTVAAYAYDNEDDRDEIIVTQHISDGHDEVEVDLSELTSSTGGFVCLQHYDGTEVLDAKVVAGWFDFARVESDNYAGNEASLMGQMFYTGLDTSQLIANADKGFANLQRSNCEYEVEGFSAIDAIAALSITHKFFTQFES